MLPRAVPSVMDNTDAMRTETVSIIVLARGDARIASGAMIVYVLLGNVEERC